jgi:hypothetical protein
MATVLLAGMILAASGDGGPDLATLGQYGVLGVFAILLVWFAKFMIGRETTRADRLEAEVVRLNNIMLEKVIPALMSATGAVEESTELLRDLQRDMRGGWPPRTPRNRHDESR